MAQDTKIQELKERVAARTAFITQAANFIMEIVEKHGRVTEHYAGSCHTKVTRVVDDLQGFSFIFRTGLSMMGGSEILVRRCFCIGGAESGMVVVFAFSWNSQVKFDLSECQVRIFEKEEDWQEALRRMFEDPAAVHAYIEENAAKRRAELAKQSREQLEIACLEAEAKRLMITY